MSNSKELNIIRPCAGIFRTDDYRTKPDPDMFWTGGNVTDRDKAINMKESSSFFMPGMWDAKKDMDHDQHLALHMYHGRRQEFDMARKKTDKDNKLNSYWGWANMFCSVDHRYGRQAKGTANQQGPKIPYDTNFSFYSDNIEKRTQGGLIGSYNLDEARKHTARWMSPVGLQFKWTNMHSHWKSAGLRMHTLFLVFTDNWAPYSMLYAPIVKDGRYTNSKSYSRGYDILSNNGEELDRNNKSGELIGFVDENSMDIIKDKFTVSACIGIYFLVEQNRSAEDTSSGGSWFPQWMDWWDMHFLFGYGSSRSGVIVPEPHPLTERMDDRKIKLIT